MIGRARSGQVNQIAPLWVGRSAIRATAALALACLQDESDRTIESLTRPSWNRSA